MAGERGVDRAGVEAARDLLADRGQLLERQVARLQQLEAFLAGLGQGAMVRGVGPRRLDPVPDLHAGGERLGLALLRLLERRGREPLLLERGRRVARRLQVPRHLDMPLVRHAAPPRRAWTSKARRSQCRAALGAAAPGGTGRPCSRAIVAMTCSAVRLEAQVLALAGDRQRRLRRGRASSARPRRDSACAW